MSDAKALRRLIDVEHRRAGWLMVPYDYIEQIFDIIAGAFDSLDTAVEEQEIFVSEPLIKMISRLEEDMIRIVTRTVYSWGMKEGKSRGDDKNIITPDMATAFILDLVADMFDKLHIRISDYDLVDRSHAKNKLILLETEYLQDRIQLELPVMMGKW